MHRVHLDLRLQAITEMRFPGIDCEYAPGLLMRRSVDEGIDWDARLQ